MGIKANIVALNREAGMTYLDGYYMLIDAGEFPENDRVKAWAIKRDKERAQVS